MSSADDQLTDLDEPALVEACLAGRAGAFATSSSNVIARPVYQLCYRFVGNHEDASDLSQDVFLRACWGLRRFKGRSSIATWLYRIAVNVSSINRVSAKAPLTQRGEPIDEQRFVDDQQEPQTDRRCSAKSAGPGVRRAVARLPRKQRMTLVLRSFHDMSHQEIAEVLGSSVRAVKANFFTR